MSSNVIYLLRNERIWLLMATCLCNAKFGDLTDFARLYMYENGIGALNFAISAGVAQEALFLRNPDSGEREKINLERIVECGFLEILTLESEAEKLRYIEIALDLDDGEAESVAIAEGRHFALATDDKKARKVIQRRGLKIELWSTCALLQHWQSKCSVSDADMGSLLARISSRAKYRPKFGHPDFEWWAKLLSK